MSNTDLTKLKDLEALIGYQFQKTSLLDEALTHPSTTEGVGYNYQRLEFLGDRVLGLVIAELLLKAFPEEEEGDIAKRHTVLVQGKTLFEIAEQLELGQYVSLSLGEHKSGGRHKATVLADTIEAIIGAIYLDSHDIEPPTAFIKRFWIDKLHSYEIPPVDSKTALQEWAQDRALPLPHYTLIEKSGRDHEPMFKIEVRLDTLPSTIGVDSSKRKAEKNAAQAMLNYIKSQEEIGAL